MTLDPVHVVQGIHQVWGVEVLLYCDALLTYCYCFCLFGCLRFGKVPTLKVST